MGALLNRKSVMFACPFPFAGKGVHPFTCVFVCEARMSSGEEKT
jgi:hypothetical protein